MRAILAMPEFPPPHSALAIGSLTHSVIEEWELGGKVPFVVTDNASAMIAAFKETTTQAFEEENPEPVTEGPETRTESDCEVVSATEDSVPTFSNDPSDDQAQNYLNSEVANDLSESLTEGEIDQEIDACEVEEEALDQNFRRGFGLSRKKRMRRLKCIAHTLQLVMGGFEKFTTARRTRPEFMNVIKRARALVTSFNMSTSATHKLIKKSGKKLIKDVATRWSSTYLLLRRLFELKKEIKEVCDELGWDGLLASDWIKIEQILKLLEPFAKYTQLVNASSTPTLCAVVPIIEELKLHLVAVLCNY